MRRPAAAFGGVYVLTQLAAVMLPPAAFLPLAAVFVCAGIIGWARGRHGYHCVFPLAILTAFAMQCIGFTLQAQPAFSLAGRRIDALAEVVSAEPGFAEDTARVCLRLLETTDSGEPLPHALVSVDVFPDCEEGQRFRVVLRLEQLEKDEYF